MTRRYRAQRKKQYTKRRRKRRRGGRKGRRTRRIRRRQRRQHKKTFLSRLRKYRGAKPKTLTSFSVMPQQSPQLQKEGEYTKLTKYTTKNVAVQEGDKIYNAIINDRLAYRRHPRGQLVQQHPDIIYGPPATLLTKNNYKKLKKGMKLYYDRGSVILRGPFIFERIIRGPQLIFSIKDAAYHRKYNFSLAVSQLHKEQMYFITKK